LLHYKAKAHPLVLNIKRTRKTLERDEPPQKMSKLAIAAETEADRYETSSEVRCLECGTNDIDTSDPILAPVIRGVLEANTFSRQEEVKAWEQEMISCEHILTLSQQESRAIQSQDLGHCSMCNLQENLWLCLECGNLGCGRAQFGGVGGHSHALAHADATQHGVAVKLGSITPDGTADVYCYRCDEERLDSNLGEHLAHWGIMLAEREKTEKSLVEMQIEQNLRWEFSMTTEDGREMRPLFGAGFTGLKNLGNSCYLASSVQCLFSLPQFAERYYRPQDPLPMVDDPAQDLETQLRKLADGLLSGRYSQPGSDVTASADSPEIPHQKGLSPSMFKHLVGRGHAEFSTMRQQDAFEFVLHLFKLVARSQRSNGLGDPTKAFTFALENRLQCLSCKKVRYITDVQDNLSIPIPMGKISKTTSDDTSAESQQTQYEPVTIQECLDTLTAEELVDLTCPGCGSNDGFKKRTMFKTFPKVLAVSARRIVLINWVPTKVDIPVIIGDEAFQLDAYKSEGLREGEELLPDDSASATSPKFLVDPQAMETLLGMGFPQNRCEKALRATGNTDPNAAMEWLFAHMDDVDIDDPTGDDSPPSAAVDSDKVESLGQMGFGPAVARKALRETNGDMERAVDWLFSHPDDTGDTSEVELAQADPAPKVIPGDSSQPANFQLQSIICHKGNSIHAG
jgi:ubiquitin carboxyl-terminal hydrolase 5/13